MPNFNKVFVGKTANIIMDDPVIKHINIHNTKINTNIVYALKGHKEIRKKNFVYIDQLSKKYLQILWLVAQKIKES